MPFLIVLQRVDCTPNAENLTKSIVEAMVTSDGLETKMVAEKLISFDCNGASILSDLHIGITVQIKL